MTLATASALAAAAGLNAYIPLLVFGLLARYTDVVTLPEQWQWLTHPVLLSIVGVLLVIELAADKIPVVDTVNDVVQTLIRPSAGGIVFASGLGAGEVVDARGNIDWAAVIAGVVIALAVHLLKSFTRPVVGGGTGGLATPVVSTVGDATSLTLTLLAVLVPVAAAAVILAVLVCLVVLAYRRLTRPRPGKYYERAGVG